MCFQVLGAVLGLTEQQCMINADDPKFIFSTSYEREDTNPPGLAGTTREYIEPFCGRWVGGMEGRTQGLGKWEKEIIIEGEGERLEGRIDGERERGESKLE